ncbi:MAG: AAA domain-containing protein [Hyphomonas sp.]|uniref:AAA domain-containing protein n=1 Tax=Hyphomonas sp. TaxID=87 RepID=UPI00352856FD
MRITNCGRGVHKREIKGLDRFRNDLPGDWYGFTNIDLVLGLGQPREVDLVIVSPRRIFLIDLKDWNGQIETVNGRWFQNGKDQGPSPVGKIAHIAREIYPLLSNSLATRPDTRGLPTPRFTGLVVLTGNAECSGIAESEKANVLTISEFLKSVATDRAERDAYGNVANEFLNRPLTEVFWKEKVTKFFNGANFKPGQRRFLRFIADETPSFEPPHGIYCEYDAHEEGSANNLGTLRLWDFTKCPETYFQSEEGRLEIAGREQEIFTWLRDRSEQVEQTLLPPKLEDPERGVQYWEIYDRRRRMHRLSAFATTEGMRLLPSEKVELARQLLAVLAGLHRQDAAHLDLGAHSIWLESPTSVRISHLFAARFPEVKSLGKNRYQFLSSTSLPEDVLGEDQGPKRRDVFLLGVAIHQLIFGNKPDGNPPEWNAEVDQDNEYGQLHDWFAEALDLDPGKRFPDAVKAHEAFLRATATRPTPDEVISGLEQFRGEIRSQRQLASAFPIAAAPIKESDRVDVWRSEIDGREVVVKLWKQAAWGDTRREGAVILSFLNRAADQKADRPFGLPKIHDVLWLGDSFAVVHEWVHGQTLGELIDEAPDELTTPIGALSIVQKLIAIVDSLHEAGHGHGDLKPDNIVIADDNAPILIDALDFSSSVDGEISTPAFAPITGSRFERDRYAITKIAEELFALPQFETEDAGHLAKAISECREKTPPLATLAPLQDAINEAVKRMSAKPEVAEKDAKQTINVSIYGADTGPLEPDEGLVYVRLRRDKQGVLNIHIRGACEEIAIRLGDEGQALSAWRHPLEQRWITRNTREEFHSFRAYIIVTSSKANDLAGLAPILDDPIVRARIDSERLQPSNKGVTPEQVDEELLAGSGDEDDAEDRLAEEVEATSSSPALVNVPLLWRNLIDSENELSTEAIASLDSSYNRQNNHHRVPLELESGVFDYARHDTVGVERQDRKGGWRRIGELDVQLTRPDMAVINANSYNSYHGKLVDAGQRLRFISHFEVQSLRRRTNAVERILEGQGRLAELLSLFDPRSNAQPHKVNHVVDEALLSSYDLNADQRQAFEQIVGTRPVGLLQGPPGTGKTRFIAALAHYAITKGLARNVLLTSQSHEAVNTAAESVLKHFRSTGIQPSLLRVAMNEDIVSPGLRPHHTQRVEQALKDRFRSAFAERLGIIGNSLGLTDRVVEAILVLETVIGPICSNLAAIVADPDHDRARVNSLVDTLRMHLQNVGLDDIELGSEEFDWETGADDISRELVRRLGKSEGVDTSQVHRLRSAAVIGRDFIGSVSRAQRSFETFLAGTRQIVVGTCVGLGKTSLGLTSTPFDLVIVDEAARCTSSELLVPLQAARWAVLVGDHAQLRPHHKAEVVDLVAEHTGIGKKEIQRSDFERVFTTGYGAESGSRLRTQYRMLPAIGRLVSETFYPDLKLQAGRTDPEIDPSVLPDGLDQPLLWIETDDLGQAAFEQRETDTQSRTNRVEADAIVALLQQWLAHEPFQQWVETQDKHPAAIGIICMYAAQRDLVRRKLRQSPLGYLLDGCIKVGTVDSYQGKENPIIVLSMVRNNDAGILERGARKIREGFLSTPNRINVATSRAMDRLVIVGARRRWRNNSPVGNLAAVFEQLVKESEARVIKAGELLWADGQETGKIKSAVRKVSKKKGGGENV